MDGFFFAPLESPGKHLEANNRWKPQKMVSSPLKMVNKSHYLQHGSGGCLVSSCFRLLGWKRCSHFDSLGFFVFFCCFLVFVFLNLDLLFLSVLPFFFKTSTLGVFLREKLPPFRRSQQTPGDEGARDVGACA